ncbi:MAG: RNA polymerase sigma factor [Gemmatimonadaceae bacterium]
MSDDAGRGVPPNGLAPEQLAARAAKGDGAALTALIEHIQDDVYRISLRMLWHPQDAEDATQEILLKLVTSVATFRRESSFRTWALRVATNHLLNVRRSRAEEERLTFEAFARDLADGLADLPAGPNDDPDQRLLEEEVKIGCTQAMLLCLDRNERIAYILGDVFELRSDDAAKVLDIESAAFRKRLSRARQRIREFMRGNCGLVSREARCSCSRRVAPAIQRGRVDPQNLLFAGHGDPAPRRLPVLEAVGEMEHLQEIAAIHQSHPHYRASERVTAEIRRVLETAKLRLLM